jgi:hypothetical protein
MTRWLWTSPDGAVTDLSAWSSSTYVVADGTSGHLAPGYEFAAQGFAGVDGEQLQQVTALPAQPVLGIDLVGDGTATSVRDRVRALAHAMRPRRGIGRLTAVADDGAERVLPCYYRKGLESGTYHDARYRAALEFWSPHPWWRGAPFTWGYGLAAAAPFFPIPPVKLSATTIAGAATVDLSDTDAPTPPRWTVTGPGSQLILQNTYDAVQPDGTLAPVTVSSTLTPPPGTVLVGDGQTITVDTRPGYQSVTRSDGADLFGWLGSDPVLWSLVDGVNEVSVLLTNAGAASRVDVVADRLYSGAL